MATVAGERSAAPTSVGPLRAPATARRRRPPAGWLAVVLGLVGIGYRLGMLLAEVPPTNSDEATSGLVALHLAQGRAAPLFFYGQHYMGAFESYLAAPLFAVLGPSTLALRLPNLLLYAILLGLVWRLSRRLYGPGLATFVVGLLAFGSDRVLKNQLLSAGGYPEMNPAGVLLVLLAVNLGLGAVRRRWLAYAGWGLVAGLTTWDDWLIGPYVAVAGVLLLAVGWRDLRGRAGLALGVGLLLGLAPIVAHNLTAAPENRSLAVYARLTATSGVPLVRRLHDGLLTGVPSGAGLCAPGGCESLWRWWGPVYPVLLLVAGALAVRGLRRADRADRVREAGRLALVAGAALTLFLYATSGAAARTPVESSRYLSCLLISTPAVLWPLWAVASRSRRDLPRIVALVALAAVVPLAALVLQAGIATKTSIRDAPDLARFAQDRRDLVAALDRLGVTRFYGEYWTCDAIAFHTRERLVCAVIRDDLRTGWDRYRPYRELVRRADRPAYVLPAGSPLSGSVAAHLAATGVPVRLTTAAGYDIYQTSEPVDLPLG